MTGDEYDELAALWSAPPRQEEARELQLLASATPRLARLNQWGELILVALLGVGICAAMVLRLGSGALLSGSLILVLLGWSAWKRHHLGNIALLIDRQDGLSYVRTLVRAKEAELQRSAIGLALILPGTLLTMLLGFSLHTDDGSDVLIFLIAVLSTARGLTALAFLLCAMLILALSHMRLVAEVARLRALQSDYEDEARWSRLAQL